MYWEYRNLLLKTFETLFVQEEIEGEIARKAFQRLTQGEQEHFDRVLKTFLAAFVPKSAWIMNIPGMFDDIVSLGIRFAEVKAYYGIQYFTTLRQRGFGETPEQVQQLLNWLRRLLGKNERLALSLLRGYRYIAHRLNADESDRYIQEGISCCEVNEQLAQQFLEGTLHDREAIIRNLTRECRLTDIAAHLEKLLFALTNQKVTVAHLGELNSHQLMQHQPHMVCMYRWVYLPKKLSTFVSREQNRNWYMLQTVAAAGMIVCKSFPCIHGHPDYKTAAALVGDSILLQNLFRIVEYTRVLKAIRQLWPGSKTLVEFGIQTEYEQPPPVKSGPEQLFFDVLGTLLLPSSPMLLNETGKNDSPRMEKTTDKENKNIRAPFQPWENFLRQQYWPPSKRELASVQRIKNLVAHSQNLFETVELLRKLDQEVLLRDYPDLGSVPLRSFGFLPDFFYSGEIRAALQEQREIKPTRWRNFAFLPDYLQPVAARPSPSDKTIRNLQHSSQQEPKEQMTSPAKNQISARNLISHENESVPAYYVYDEWSQEKNMYRRRYCYVYEKNMPFTRERTIPPDVIVEGNKIRRIFELLKPDAARKEKRLAEGDEINATLLIDYMIATKQEPCPQVQFFEKPALKKRDIAVLLLLDVSGSTVETVNNQKVLDIEKHAALIFGQGLAALGDRFTICGFSSNGPKQCEFVIFKDFEDAWDSKSRSRVLSARSMSCTRMGAALRHAGRRLWKEETRQKLIMIITDGKPLDKEYSPETHYAQHDVRMSCLENRRQGIVTFCLSTLENCRSDLELMFPEKRFVILSTLRQLTQLLPKCYMKLTL